MTALDHALAWVNGETIEAGALMAFGLVLMGCSGLLWRFGATPASRALVLPLLVVGVSLVVLVLVGGFNNLRRPSAFREAYELDPGAFVRGEIARVEGFMRWYVYTFAAGSILIAGGLAAFFFLGATMSRAIGLVMIVLGTAGLFIDFFGSPQTGVGGLRSMGATGGSYRTADLSTRYTRSPLRCDPVG